MKKIWITNRTIIKILNFLANSTLIDSVVLGNKIVFNLNGYISGCEDEGKVLRTFYEIGYLNYIKKTIFLQINIFKGKIERNRRESA